MKDIEDIEDMSYTEYKEYLYSIGVDFEVLTYASKDEIPKIILKKVVPINSHMETISFVILY